MSRAERNTNYLGLKPHLNQSKTKCKMHINLNAKSKDCSRRGGGGGCLERVRLSAAALHNSERVGRDKC